MRNPPYQIEAPGTSTSDKPVYHLFIEEGKKIADKVELVTPGRFLFNAGATPKSWNEEMLSDPRFSVLYFNQKSEEVFPNTDIKGGVAVTYWDKETNHPPIGIFTPFPELNSIISKVKLVDDLHKSLDDLIFTQNKFDLDELNSRIPGLNRRDKRLESNAFKLPVFDENEHKEAFKILGLEKGKRIYKYIDKKLIDLSGENNLYKWKVILPKSNGSGAIGEVLSTPLIGTPLIGYTRTFISIGSFDTEEEANSAFKYIKSKFCRAMLGVLKITQDNNPGKWKYVPLQNFKHDSDINWSVSIPEIDQQLYKKYGLSEIEINFIESHVKEMN